MGLQFVTFGDEKDSAAADGGSDGSPARGRTWTRWVVRSVVGLLLLVVPMAVGRQAMQGVPVFQLDGAFQTASGLFRLADGEFPGRDFLPYLGTGPVLLLFPLFLVAGTNLAASVFSSFAVTQIVFQTVVGVIAMLSLPRRAGRSFAVGAGLAAVLTAAAMVRPEIYAAQDGLLTLVATPGNSLRPIRAAAPYVLALVAFLLLRHGWSVRRAAGLGSVAGVVMALWSNDYGLASGGLILVLVSLLALRQGWAPRWSGLLCMWGGAVAAFVTSGFLATAGGFLPLLRYNLVDVRGDQFWYFGPWALTDRIYTLGDLVRSLMAEHALPALLTLVVTLVLAVLRLSLEWVLVLFLGGATLAGGLAATVGGHIAGYYWSFVLWGNLVAGLLLVRLVLWCANRLRHPVTLPRTVRRCVAVGAVASLAVSGGAALYEARKTGGDIAEAGGVAVPALGGLISPEYLPQLDAVEGLDVVEEYSGLAGALNGPTEGLDVDSVIAALGDQRAAFADYMTQPHDLVVTASPSIIWTTWGLSANWWFYRELFRSYAPEVSSPLTVNWRPATPRPWIDAPCGIEGDQIRLTTPEAGVYEVDLRYRGPGHGAREFTMVEDNITVAAGAQGYHALDPGADEQRFPVLIRDTQDGTKLLSTRQVSDSAEPITQLVSCTASLVRYPDGADTAEVYGSFLSAPVDLTDVNWVRGVARASASLLVFHTDMNLADLQRARSIQFSNGEVRPITGVVVSGPAGELITVSLAGEPLDPATAGAPNQITFLY